MKAGREMDALVAEKVMGLVLTSPVDPRFDHSVGTNRDGSSAKRNFCRWPDGREHWIPFFSTDISDAWQVVEKLAGAGKYLALQAPGSTDMNECYRTFPKWTADFAYCDSTEAQADTAPLAICLAALKAVGVDVNSPK